MLWGAAGHAQGSGETAGSRNCASRGCLVTPSPHGCTAPRLSSGCTSRRARTRPHRSSSWLWPRRPQWERPAMQHALLHRARQPRARTPPRARARPPAAPPGRICDAAQQGACVRAPQQAARGGGRHARLRVPGLRCRPHSLAVPRVLRVMVQQRLPCRHCRPCGRAAPRGVSCCPAGQSAWCSLACLGATQCGCPGQATRASTHHWARAAQQQHAARGRRSARGLRCRRSATCKTHGLVRTGVQGGTANGNGSDQGAAVHTACCTPHPSPQRTCRS